MDFKTFYFGLSPDERAAYAERVTSTVGYLNQVAYGHKRIELGAADVLVAVSGGRLTLADLPLTDRALQQHQIRTGAAPAAASTANAEA